MNGANSANEDDCWEVFAVQRWLEVPLLIAHCSLPLSVAVERCRGALWRGIVEGHELWHDTDSPMSEVFPPFGFRYVCRSIASLRPSQVITPSCALVFTGGCGVWLGRRIRDESGPAIDTAAALEAAKQFDKRTDLVARIVKTGHVESLTFVEPTMSEADLAALAKLALLRDLNLKGSAITDAQVAQLSGLVSLKSLILSHTQVSDAGLVHLANSKQLLALYIDDTRIGDPTLKGVGQLRELTNLDLSKTQVTDAGLVELAPLQQLSALALNDLPITDQGLIALQR